MCCGCNLVYACVCVCVCERVREKYRDKLTRDTSIVLWFELQSELSLCMFDCVNMCVCHVCVCESERQRQTDKKDAYCIVI